MPSSKVEGFKLTNVDKKLQKKVREQVRSHMIRHFRDPLRKIVSVFENNIYIEDKSKTTGDSFSVTVQARPGIMTTSRVSNTPIETSKIFEYLNNGTDERFVAVHEKYQRASEPNSLVTKLVNNERKRYSFTDVSMGKIEARNWISLLEQDNAVYTEKLIQRIFNTLASQFIGK